MGLIVIHPGVHTTVQDPGRPGWREVGVGPGGACDHASHGLANALLGNPPDCATVEMTALGGKFRATEPLAVAWAGAPMPVTLIRDDERARRPLGPGAIPLQPGDRLEFGGASAGLRCYLAVVGGWQSSIVLGSRSSEQPLRPQDLLHTHPTAQTRFAIRLDDPPPDPTDGPLRIIPGPDAHLLPAGARENDGWPSWRVTPDGNRTGLRLESPEADWSSAIPVPADRLSTPVAPGAIQWTGRQMLILGAACGTMGGYPHIAHVIAADLDRLGQARPGDRLDFAWTDPTTARRIDREQRSRRDRRRLIVSLFAT